MMQAHIVSFFVGMMVGNIIDIKYLLFIYFIYHLQYNYNYNTSQMKEMYSSIKDNMYGYMYEHTGSIQSNIFKLWNMYPNVMSKQNGKVTHPDQDAPTELITIKKILPGVNKRIHYNTKRSSSKNIEYEYFFK